MTKQAKQRQIMYIAILAVADFIFFSSTNPATLPSFILILGFIFLIATLYVLVRLLIAGLCLNIPTLRRTRSRLAMFITGILGVLLALQSIGQLTTRDTLVVVPIATVLYLYFTYARPKMRPQA
jgi:hypothetical protein